jgi:hypothetical protein
MRRALLICTLLVPLLGAAAAHAASVPGAGVKLLACVPALEQQERTATFEARVRPARGSERMQVRFTLQEREEVLAPWRRVVAPGFDEWLTSDPGVTRYSYSKVVQNLAAPATYRAVVRFRWLASDGAVLMRSRATSRSCRQPDMRPDVAATRIEVLPLSDYDQARYVVTVRNTGRSAAGAFSVGLRVGDEELIPLALPGLGAGELLLLRFTGPACVPGAPLTAIVDPDQAVDERDEDDNVLSAICPP